MCLYKMIATFLICALFLSAAAGPGQAHKDAKEIVIEIIPDDAKVGLYVEPGQKQQKPIEVKVGQSVVWKNTTDEFHTATSKLKVKDAAGKEAPLFNEKIKSGASSKRPFTKEDYDKAKAAGAKVGAAGELTLEYFCAPHKGDGMGSAIILKP